jgi:hypothetical protein
LWLYPHLLFVDDIMIFGQGSSKEMKSIKKILDIYCKATVMEVNMTKSLMLFNVLEEEVKMQVLNLFPMNYVELDQGVKYLGFKLKPNDYKYVDWL